MSHHKAKPPGNNKTDSTGIPSDFTAEKYNRDASVTNKFIDENRHNAEQVKTKHPNRTTNKVHATNIHGYRN